MSNQAPSEYMRRLEAEASLPGDWLDDIVGTHLVEPKHLRADDFAAFYTARSAELLKLIEEAMGKRAVSSDAAPESATDYQPEQLA